MESDPALAKQNSDLTEKTGIYRVVVERSSMSNNDEIVFHTDLEYAHETWKESKTYRAIKRPYEDPKLVLCRSVFLAEIKEGLDCTFIGETYDETPPKITMVIDGLQRLLDSIGWRAQVFKEPTPANLMQDFIAYAYYDCMSGGMPSVQVVACRYLIEKYKCDLSTPVYPGKVEGETVDMGDQSTWYTLGDWMEETGKRRDEDLEAMVGQFLGQMKIPLLGDGR